MRHPPYVDRRKTASCASVNGRRVRGADILPPLAEVAEDRDSADLDIIPFWHVDIDVPEGQQDGRGRARLVDGGFAQIEVQVAEGGGCEGPAAKSQPPAPHDMTEHGRGEAGPPTTPTGARRRNPPAALLHPPPLPSAAHPSAPPSPP